MVVALGGGGGLCCKWETLRIKAGLTCQRSTLQDEGMSRTTHS